VEVKGTVASCPSEVGAAVHVSVVPEITSGVASAGAGRDQM